MLFYILVVLFIIFKVVVVDKKFLYRPCNTFQCMVGKTVLITGGSSGIGLNVALSLAARGAKIIIGDINTSDTVKNEIIKQTGNDNIILKHLNLASFKSIRDFVKDLYATESKIDILINNAGIAKTTKKPTEDELDIVMQVNYFGPFLLTHLLIDLLKKSTDPRILFTASHLSFVHNVNATNFENVLRKSHKITTSWEEIKHTVLLYSNSKMFTIVASDIFAEKLKNTSITCNAIHPGCVRTPIFETGHAENYIWRYFTRFCLLLIGITSLQGAQTTIYVATSNECQKTTGKYFSNCSRFFKPPFTSNSQICQKIWDISEKIVKLEESEKL